MDDARRIERNESPDADTEDSDKGDSRTGSKNEDHRAMTSMRVFREFIVRIRDKHGRESIDASGIISRECYDLWVATRKHLPPHPEKAFQRSLSAHVTGVDGRIPFTAIEEAAILKVLRRKERWPCFEQTSTRFGLMGFRAKGHHEKLEELGATDTHYDSRKRMREDDDGDNESVTDVTSPLNYNRLIHPMTGVPLSMHMAQNMPVMSSLPMSTLSALAAKPDDFSFTPQIPIDPSNLLSGRGEFSFLEAAGALLSRFYGVGLDAWSTVLSLGRMQLVSKGWSEPPTVEDAKRLVRELEARHPNKPILALDPTARHLRDRILALTTAAEEYLGPVARDQSGLDRRLIPLSEGWTVLKTAFHAYHNPLVEQKVRLNIMCKDNTLRQAMCYFTAHPAERMLILRADPL